MAENGIDEQERSDSAEPGEPTRDPVPSTSERVFTQAELDQIIAERLRRERAKHAPREDVEATEPAKQTEPAGDRSVEDLQREVQRLERGRAFDRLASRHASLNETQREVLERLFHDAAPSDPKGWLDRRVEQLFGSSPPSANTNGSSQQDTTARLEPGPDRGSVSSQPTWKERELRPNEWTRDDVQRIYAEKGREKGQRFIRQSVESWLKTVNVVPRR